MKFFGTVRLCSTKDGERVWEVRCEPFVLAKLKRVLPSVGKRAIEVAKLTATPEVAADLAWFLDRYPMQVDPADVLAKEAAAYHEHVQTIADLVGGHVPPPKFELALPPRDYQAIAAGVYMKAKALLLGDEVGLGKTAVGIASFTDPRFLPAVVVAPAHLCRQWVAEVARFCPALDVHGIRQTAPYKLPEYFGKGPDVLVLSYHKLSGWALVLREYCRSMILDECHELRHPSAEKYAAAIALRAKVEACLGLSATPIFNYGGEVYNVLDVLKPGALGTRAEFANTWCKHDELGNPIPGKQTLKDPRAFGSWLRSEGLMLRRTRRDVGRELPPVSTIPLAVDADTAALDAAEDAASELARIVLGTGTSKEEREARLSAAGQLDTKLRQATGIAKAKYVAAFVASLVESGETVLLGGWHRTVWKLWAEAFTKAGIRFAMFTGEETDAQKDAGAQKFRKGEVEVLGLSLRSGAGLNGLQDGGSIVVFGELDWSPAVHEQFVGRLNRDGQTKPVLAYYCLADSGADPMIAETLGVKRAQLSGIRGDAAGDLAQVETVDRSRKLATEILKRREARRERRAVAS